jgi:hypothetical protein
MRAQLQYLIDAGREPHISIQVLRLGCQMGRLPPSSFGILSFAEPDDADVVCATGLRGQVLLEHRPAEVQAVRRTFDALTELADPPRKSADLISKVAAGL